MKSYQMSFDDLERLVDHKFRVLPPEKIRELVEKDTPRRPIMKKFNEAKPWDCADYFVEREACLVCRIRLPKDTLYCCYCGQRIDRK